jgi:predicted AAA+ superfamily ATPase
MYTRLLGAKLKKTKKSILLLGPRQVGKSTLIRSLKPDLEINLANEAEYYTFQSELDELTRRISATKAKIIFIDEIQRIPRLTNTVQQIVDENKNIKFYLTGSSARRLRKGKANLLPGRVLNYQMSGLTLEELGSSWDETLHLRFGFLPGVLNSRSTDEKKKILQAYSNSYLKEEIQAEAIVRRIDGFVRFLNSAALESGRFVDYSKLAKRAKIPRQSVARHFEVLQDTLIANVIVNDPDLMDAGVDLVKHPRIYFFDLGVLNALRGSFEVNQERIGFLFEHLVYQQIMNTSLAKDLNVNVYNFRTRGGLEIDFIVEHQSSKFAVECKSADTITSSDLRGLESIDRYYPKIARILVYRGKRELKDGNIWILPLKKALVEMGL